MTVDTLMRGRWLQSLVLLVALILGVGSSAQGQGDTAASLKIIVYGSTGRVGSRVITEALSRGHQVTAVSRDATRITQRHDNLSVVQGELLDSNSVADLVAGQDLVVVSVRGSVGDSRDPEQSVQRVAAEVIVDVLRGMEEGAPRLLYVGGAGSLEVEPGVLYADSIPRIARMMMPRSVRQEIAGHVLTLEYLRAVEDVRWTYISPPKDFGPGERTGSYRVGGDQMLEDEDGESAISMEDFSIALIDEAENPQHERTRFTVAY